MNAITYIVLFFWLFGYYSNSSDEILYERDFSNQKTNIIQNANGDQIKQSNLPKGFTMDSLVRDDTSRNMSLYIAIPISGNKVFDSIVKLDIEKQKNDFIYSLDTKIKRDKRILTTISSSFEAYPVSVFRDSKITSYLFIVSYYHGGAVHPMTMYYSFNFDNKTFKRIFFNDYFIIRTKSDTVILTQMITNAIGLKNVTLQKLYDLDFNIENDSTISFNFDDYEIASYGEGIIQGRIQKAQLLDKIHKTYR